MPHIIIHAKEEVLQTYCMLYRHTDLEYVVEEIISEVFNLILDEKLTPGENVKTDGVFVSSTMPVGFHFTILAWYRESRLQKQQLLQMALKARVEEALWEFAADVHLVIVGAPPS